MDQKENKMGTVRENKLLVTMSMPLILSMFIQALYNIVDSIFVARLSEDALTAISLAFPIQSFMLSIALGTGVGLNALLSRNLGRKNNALVNSVAEHGIVLSFFSAVSCAIFGLLFTPLFFKTQTTSPTIYQYGVDYLSIVTLFSIGLFFQVLAERLLQSTGMTMYTMMTQAIGAVINILFDPILIFGLFGFPRLEVKGAAIATVFGQMIGAMVGLWLNARKNSEITICLRTFRWNSDIVKSIYAIGIPSTIMNSISSVMVYCMNKILMPFTETAVAAFGIFYKLQSIIFLPMYGINNAMVPIVAYNYGAQNKKRVKKTIRYAIVYSNLILAVGIITILTFPHEILRLFDANQKILEIGIPMLRIIMLSYLPVAFSIIAVSVFQALGHGFLSMIDSFLRQIIVLIPSAYLLSKMGGLQAVWFSFTLAEITSFITCMIFLRKIYKYEINLLPSTKLS